MGTYNHSDDLPSGVDEHISTKKDIAGGVWISLILGILFIVVGSIAFFLGMQTQQKDQDFLEHSTVVSALVTDVQTRTSADAEHSIRYYFMLEYSYGGLSYRQLSDYVTEEELSANGLSKKTAVGKVVGAYIDTRNPSSVRLRKPSDGIAVYFTLFFPFVGICMLLWAVRFAVGLKKGRYLVSKHPGYTNYQKIKADL